MKREGEEQLPSPLYGFDAPLLTPQTHSAHARTHMCREGEKGGGGGLWRERERKGKQRGEYNKENTVWSNNTASVRETVT